MARNGSGTYSVPNTFVAGNTITASSHNANWTDIGSEMTNSLALDGQSTMTGVVKGANGTVSAPSYTFGTDTNTDIYRIGADNLGIAVNGTKLVDVAATAVGFGATLNPVSSDGAALGTGTLMFSDVFLASGAVVNFNNGDVTVTHAANALAFAGASTGYSFDATVLGADGTKTAPGLSFSADTDTGIYRIGANNIGVSCGDTKIIDIATTGAAVTGTLSSTGNATFSADVSAATVSGSAVASQSDMETATSTTTIVTPGRTKFHPGVTKAWVMVTVTGGTPAATVSNNVTSLTDTGVGLVTVNFTTAFSTRNYAVTTAQRRAATSENLFSGVYHTTDPTSSACVLFTNTPAPALEDAAELYADFFGDQ